MRRRIILALVAVLVLCLGVLVAVLVVTRRNHTKGELDTALQGVTVTRPKPRTVPRPHRRKPKPVYVADKPCWLNFGGNPERTLARADINLGAPTKALWVRGLHSYIEFPPSYCDGALYVNTFRGVTYAIDARTGKTVWQRSIAGLKPSTPAIAGDRLIVASTAGTVTALARSDGHTLWQFTVDAKVESSPVALGRTAYFGASDGRLFAVSTTSGHVRWAYRTGGIINSSPSVWGRRICITTYAGSVFCLDRHNGHLLWVRYIQRDFLRDASFYASASTDGTRLFTLSRSGLVIALRASDGATLWSHDLSVTSYTTPAVAKGRVFVGDFNGLTHCYQAATGRELWRHSIGGRILGAPIVVGRLVFFSNLEQRTYALRVSDGREVWHVRMGKYSPGIATNRHYYFTLNGLLIAYRGRYSPREPAATGAVSARARKRDGSARTSLPPKRAAPKPPRHGRRR